MARLLAPLALARLAAAHRSEESLLEFNEQIEASSAASGLEGSLLEGNWSLWSATESTQSANQRYRGELDAILQGMGALKRASHKGCDLDITDKLDIREEDQADVVRVTDMRGCYPYLSDPCPDLEVLEEQLSEDTGSKTPLLAPGFEHEYVVKKIGDNEVFPMRSALLKLYAEASAELQVRKTRTLITPICAMVTVKHQSGDSNFEKAKTWLMSKIYVPETWIVMRRARLAQGDTTKFGLRPQAIKMFDLKGQIPFGSAIIGKPDNVSDTGFQEAFSMGLEIMSAGGCSSCTEIQEMLHEDSALLESMQLTGYSLLVQVYEAADETKGPVPSSDMCARDRFPHVFEARDRLSKLLYFVSFGIIGYGSSVTDPALALHTKLKPGEYRSKFQDMFKSEREGYFDCHHE